jgi:hypothetical protein
LFGFLQHVRVGEVTGPVGHEDALFGQQRLCVVSPQYSTRLLQHFLPHSSCCVPQRLQIPRSGFWQRQLSGQQLAPQRERPLGHFGVHVSTRWPPRLMRRHSAPGGQHTPLQTTCSGGHGWTQTPLKQTSVVGQQTLPDLLPQNERPSGQANWSPHSPLAGRHFTYQGQQEPANPSDV